MLTPHHDGSPLHVSNAAPALGEVVRVRLRVPRSAIATDGTPIGVLAWVGTRSNPNREPRFDQARLVAADVDGWDWYEASVEVENPEHGYRWLLVGADGRQHWLSQAGLSDVETRDHDDFRLVAHAPAPAWAAGSVMYQVFPDRFAKSDASPYDARRAAGDLPEWLIPADWDDAVDPEPPGRSHQVFGGDLDGVRERLDHLASLGVDLLYLTPVFPARSNHRYDASTFGRVDDLLGGDDALVRLVEAAHARGIRVIGDLTSNHSGDAHEWFRLAQDAVRSGADAAERGFYFFRPDGSYESWLGVPSLPKFDWSSTELRRRFVEGPDSVVAKYLRAPFSLDGWRIDVANMTGRLGDVDLNAEVRRAIRRTMLEANPDTILLAESTNDAAADFQGDAWHGAMTYAPFTRPLWSWLQRPGSPAGGGIGFALGRVPSFTARQFVDAHLRFAAGFPWRVRLATMNALDTHDTPRFATNARPGTQPVAFGLAVTLPGIPVIWAGDELGLTGVDGEASRTPMPWAAIDEGDDPGLASTLGTYRALARLRREYPVLATGGIRWVAVGDEAVAFVREAADASVLVFAARDAARLEAPAGVLPQLGGSAEPDASPASTLVAFGSARLAASGEASDCLALEADGPAFAAWLMPGVAAPAR
ncbi:glycoside hydrolase family 13 protein [Agromyces intestinalis]|uniref:Glycoside hydrolase family 13 protein n=1 Tax=Agromyces intestinalis TaxID=2592652 RepID=A0A5C1YG96_9MICO|nr:glycoside hydrolase family 13 protein [Agromyces intestinalis]QEO14109.1 glycoside hydrolase family 13 protein [Agromyces intestinalis]